MASLTSYEQFLGVEEEKTTQLNMKKLQKKIEEIEEIIKTLPGLKAQLKELEDGSSSSSSSSPGESKTEAPSFQFCDFSLPPPTAPTKDVSLGGVYLLHPYHSRVTFGWTYRMMRWKNSSYNTRRVWKPRSMVR